jgi:hypothetical protein
MNPLSLILIGLGLIMIYVGWKGSQHQVISEILGHGTQATQTADAGPDDGTTPAKGTPAGSSTPPATNASTPVSNV